MAPPERWTTDDLLALKRKIWRRARNANLVAIIPPSLFFILGARYFHPTAKWYSPTFLPLPWLVYVPGWAYAKWHANKLFRPIANWAASDREPTPDERELVIDYPRRMALDAFYHWLWGLVLAMISGAVNFDGLGFQFVNVAVAILMSAMIAAALVYLVVEDALRPLYARALRESAPRRTTVGVRPRLTLIWVVGAATYFVGIVVVMSSFPVNDSRPFVVGTAVFGLVVGALVTRAGARSVADPLDGVSAALARVEEGDLDVTVPVDDAGEVGRLQAGFNRMVAGLRERQRLEQLFARSVGPDVAQRAMASSGLEGKSIEATVMFVDIIGSTTLASERPAESVVSMINALFESVIRIVGSEGGMVNQFQGDGALCVFGAPLEIPDHAACGLRAALALRREVVALADVYPGFDAAIGVSTGRVVAGDVGTEDRSEYTVIGDAANEASRLTDQAKLRPSRVLASEQTINEAGGDSSGWLAAGMLELRGRPQPTGAFEPA